MSFLTAFYPRVFSILSAMFLAPFVVFFGLMMSVFALGLFLISVGALSAIGKQVEDANFKVPQPSN
ncbi:hypothetical protein [Roseibium sp. RKSG952]|uniref:hypothetical protein n=1 Tax=Roseibium sp. RKSG952 TaxID=2529384 RepID=UPI0012BD47A5|nr:hypothetical protein [Roseibium sp. RKSG952]MTI02835.1 hypothetical protein [Roseibium sp. RKSG952]